MALALDGCCRVLAPGRYAVFVAGDAIFKGTIFSTSNAIAEAGSDAGLEVLGVIDRPIHRTKRSFAKPRGEPGPSSWSSSRRPNRPISVRLNPPTYRMWSYEHELRSREIESLTGNSIDARHAGEPVTLSLSQPALWHLRRLAFTSEVMLGSPVRRGSGHVAESSRKRRC